MAITEARVPADAVQKAMCGSENLAARSRVK